jgi:capsule polysaccharide export protein KpsE/RkpR
MNEKNEHKVEHALNQTALKKWAKPRVEFSRRDIRQRTKVIKELILESTIKGYNRANKESAKELGRTLAKRTKDVEHNYYTITNNLSQFVIKSGNVEDNKYVSYVPVILIDSFERNIIKTFGKIVDLSSLTKEEIIQAEYRLGIKRC